MAKAPLESLHFEVALSFPGKHDEWMRSVAEALATAIGQERVFYHKWYDAELARANLDLHLQNLYHSHSLLIVCLLCKEYTNSDWCGLELRVCRDLVKSGQADRVMFLRLDDETIPGLLGIDGYLDVRDMPALVVAQKILRRLGELSPTAPPDFERMVSECRAAASAFVERRCRTVRVLRMEHPIDLSSIYAEVNVLEKRTSNQRLSREELASRADRDTFDRFGLLTAEVERSAATTLFKHYLHVIIYGKPGAGKTTFLKYLASACAKGDFMGTLVPAFVSLKDFAEGDGAPNLFRFIQAQWHDAVNARDVLRNGRGLVLLDGLDEVREQDFHRIRKEIEDFETEFRFSVIVVTCRIAAREYVFERFVEVELADFNQAQIRQFVNHWFRVQGEPSRSKLFLERIDRHKPVYELATNPLLLTLLCLIFQELNEFGGTRKELYEEGLRIMLREWDGRRGIDRPRPLGLTFSELEDLLTDIAFSRFRASEYFFATHDLEQQIDRFCADKLVLADLTGAPAAEIVLRAVEANTGLLVQRAVNVYSFSHLTFQEYLAARHVSKKQSLLADITSQIAAPRWREFWLLLSTMIHSDDIFPKLASFVQRLTADDPSLREHLSKSIGAYSLADGVEAAAAARSLDVARSRAVELIQQLAAGRRFHGPDAILSSTLEVAVTFDQRVRIGNQQLADSGVNIARAFGTDRSLAIQLAQAIQGDQGCEPIGEPEPAILSTLRATLAALPAGPDPEWWSKQWPSWSSRLSDAAGASSRPMNEETLNALAQYCRATALLAECLISARSISRQTRDSVVAAIFPRGVGQLTD
jgi:hypothetical protein